VSTKTERAGQRIGDHLVLPDEGKRSKRGRVLWPVLNTRTSRVKYWQTYVVSRMAREAGVPRPTLTPMSRTHAVRVASHRPLLDRRGFAQSAEDAPPVGQAGFWWDQVQREVPYSARLVARQLARLCGDDSKITVTWRSLADAVGQVDGAGRHIAFTQRGVEVLIGHERLRVVTVGRGPKAHTTFYLLTGLD
jgi:hypothetical protein